MIQLNMKATFPVNISIAIKTGVTQDTLSIFEVIDHQPSSDDPFRNFYFLSLMLANLFVGLFYRILVFRQIWKTGGLFGRPINLLSGNFDIRFEYFCFMSNLYSNIRLMINFNSIILPNQFPYCPLKTSV